MKKLAIGIMVKNETHIITRCLNSILSLHPDLVIIIDTGSSDDTILKSALFLHKYTIPFKIYREKFQDFAFNRSLILKKCQEEPIDYVFMIDADEVIKINNHDFSPQIFKDSLFADLYNITLTDGKVSYRLPRLTSNKISFRYVGVTHECLDEMYLIKLFAPQISIVTLNDGYRRTSNQKYINDIILLEQALLTEQNENLKTRYLFYLAQSYYYNNEWQKAMDVYRKRINAGGWEEEIFYSYYQIGNIYALYNPFMCFGDALFNYLKAYEILPTRAESLQALINLCEITNHRNLFNIFLSIKQDISMPDTALFLDSSAYNHE